MILKPLPKATVLVLEEDPFLSAGLCGLVTKAGYLLAECRGEADLERRIDLVLAGIGAHPALRLRERAVPLILLVDHRAWSGLDFLDVANELGANAVLPRPFSRSALLSLMAKLLTRHDAAAAERVQIPGPTERSIYRNSPNFV